MTTAEKKAAPQPADAQAENGLGAPVLPGAAEAQRHPENERFKFAVTRVNPAVPDGGAESSSAEAD